MVVPFDLFVLAHCHIRRPECSPSASLEMTFSPWVAELTATRVAKSPHAYSSVMRDTENRFIHSL